MDRVKALGQRPLKGDHSCAPNVNSVKAHLIDQRDAAVRAEAYSAKVYGAFGLPGTHKVDPAFCGHNEGDQVRAVCDVASNVVSLTRQGCELELIARSPAHRQTPNASVLTTPDARANNSAFANDEAAADEITPQ
jgi:hypothetical protein